MTAVVATLAGLAVAAAVLVLVQTAGRGRLARHLATTAGVVCLVLFVLINVSDWPGGFLNQFWVDHAIVGATAGSLLLAATIFLVYRYRDQRQQDLIDESIVDAARSELVDRLVDIDVALALLCQARQPDLCSGMQWRSSRHGLEWLRDHFDEAGTNDVYWSDRDPRLWGHADHVRQDEWRLQLLNQMSRRISGGIRDWGPILMKSRQGQQDLVAFANVRVVLLELDRQLRRHGSVDTRAARVLQGVVRRFAHLLEVDQLTVEPRKKLSVPGEQRPKAVEALEDEMIRMRISQINTHVDRRTTPVRRSRTASTGGAARASAASSAPEAEDLAGLH